MRRPLVFLATLLLGASVDARAQAAVDQLSVTSLKLSVRHDDVEIGSATGFVVRKGQRYYLITNRHVVLACAEDRDANDVGGWLCANNLEILHNKVNSPGQWLQVKEVLYDGNEVRRWAEHPTLGSSVDLVALPLVQTEGVAFFPLDLDLQNTDILLAPGEPVDIVGFPRGLAQAGGLAIWKTGTIASDIEISIEGKPKFLLDTTARPGMSGSPVYARRVGPHPTSTVGLLISPGVATKFLGVYAQQSEALEIGLVWKAAAVKAIYDSLP